MAHVSTLVRKYHNQESASTNLRPYASTTGHDKIGIRVILFAVLDEEEEHLLDRPNTIDHC